MPSFAVSWPAPLDVRDDFGGIERRGKPLLFVVVARAIPETRPADAGGAMPAQDVAVGVLAEQIVDEEILRDDGVAFHPHHLGDVGDTAGTVAKAGGLGGGVERGASPFPGRGRG